MAGNRFEQVDEPAEDAITLTLARDGERNVGRVLCPAAIADGRFPGDYASDELPLKHAISAAVALANELRLPLVVSDPDGLWHADWGELYRYSEDGAGS